MRIQRHVLWRCSRTLAKLANTTVVWRSRPGESPRISAYALYFRKLESLGYLYAADSMGLPSFVKCEVAQNCMKICNSNSRSSKVIGFGTSRKRICDFLLVINSNLCHILHRFWATATYWLKITYFPTPLLFGALAPYVPLEFRNEVNHEETRVMGLLCGESCIILTSTVFDWSTRVKDRQTDKRTGDGI